MVVAIVLGLVLWLGYGVGKGPGNYWLHAKLVLVVGAIGYHHACRSLLRKFEEFANEKSERWFRVFNEAAVVLFTLIVILVVVKPFWNGPHARCVRCPPRVAAAPLRWPGGR